ncbi:MAG TPA: hypothetical protein VJZ25_01645 [Gemmatimonadaceae bacterium]|nr:hypothetical protein [Gemmatimonadaceae bacterium]
MADHVDVAALGFVRLLRRAPGVVRFDAGTVALGQRCFRIGESARECFSFRLERFPGANQLLLGALPRNEDAVRGAARDVL